MCLPIDLLPARVRAGKQSDRPGLRKRCMENRLGHGWDNRRRSTPRIRQQFEVYNHDSLSRLVDRPVRDIARLEVIVSLLVYRGFRTLHIGQFSFRYVTNAGADVVMLANVAAGLEYRFGDAKFILPVEFDEVACNRRFELHLRSLATLVNNWRLSRRASNRQEQRGKCQ